MRRWLYVLGVSLACLLALELSLRALMAIRVGPSAFAYGVVPDRDERRPEVHDNIAVGYSKYFPRQHRVDYDVLTGERFQVTINAQGFRGADFPTSKPAGTIRVVTLGASSTFGYHDRDDETYPHYLEQELNRQCPWGGRFEVLNLGIPHLTAQEILALYLAEVVPLEPDFVTFYEGVNDASFVADERGQARQQLRRVSPLRAAFRFVRDRVLLVRLVDDALATKVRTHSAAEVAQYAGPRRDRFLRNLARLEEEVRARRATLVVASQQAKSGLYDDERIRGVSYAHEVEQVKALLVQQGFLHSPELLLLTHAELMQDLKAWAGARGVAFADAAAALDDRRDLLVSWVHLLPEGNRVVAKALAAPILARACPRQRSARNP